MSTNACHSGFFSRGSSEGPGAASTRSGGQPSMDEGLEVFERFRSLRMVVGVPRGEPAARLRARLRRSSVALEGGHRTRVGKAIQMRRGQGAAVSVPNRLEARVLRLRAHRHLHEVATRPADHGESFDLLR